MTLSLKGRRLLHVEGVDYFWRSTPGEAGGVVATVELAGAPGGKLLIAGGGQPSPGVVAHAIQCARAQGWDPSQPGAFRVGRRGLLAPQGR